MGEILYRTFSSLKIRNFRIYYFSQVVSYCGTFLQALAQDWLVLKLTNSGTMLGLVSAFQFLPLLLFIPFGGVIADRFSKRKLLIITQTLLGLFALFLGILILSGAIKIWMVFVLALCLGLTNSIDNPTRQTFIFEMVGAQELKNAVSLWGTLISVTRIVGPALAGILIAIVGIGQCFIVNALTFVPVVLALAMINKEKLHTVPSVPRAKGQIRDGLKYVWATPVLLHTLVMMAVIGTLTYEWQASLPLFARFVLNGDAQTYSVIMSMMGVGMIIGGLINAANKTTSQKRMVYSALLFGVFILISAFVSTLTVAVITFTFVGIFSIGFNNVSQATLQINTDSKMRGRVMSLWSMAFQGSTAIGGPIIGWIGEVAGANWALATGGIAAVLAAFYGLSVFRGKDNTFS